MDKFIIVGLISIVFVVTSVSTNISKTIAQEQPTAVVKVAAGGGNATAPWTI
jgi:hypothetical protein